MSIKAKALEIGKTIVVKRKSVKKLKCFKYLGIMLSHSWNEEIQIKNSIQSITRMQQKYIYTKKKEISRKAKMCVYFFLLCSFVPKRVSNVGSVYFSIHFCHYSLSLIVFISFNIFLFFFQSPRLKRSTFCLEPSALQFRFPMCCLLFWLSCFFWPSTTFLISLISPLVFPDIFLINKFCTVVIFCL